MLAAPPYKAEHLLVRAAAEPSDPDLLAEITSDQAGWNYINFQARRLAVGAKWHFSLPSHCELAVISLGGCISLEARKADSVLFYKLGQRKNVFDGKGHLLYLPRGYSVEILGNTAGDTGFAEFALAWAPTETDCEPRHVKPSDVSVEIRGGGHATRQINSLLPAGFGNGRLTVVEVYTPSGNWSSYPPHKHDSHTTTESGDIVEADLEEIYFYKISNPSGFAFQRVYTDPTSPLALSGHEFDVAVCPRSNDIVLIPEGYHPVGCPPGWNCYYLNVLCGTVQGLTARDDPRLAWVKPKLGVPDGRSPIYPLE